MNMNPAFARSVFVGAFFLIGSTGSSAADPSLDTFRSQPDNRLAVRASLGVRSAAALDARRVRIAIGMSVTEAAQHAESYRIISFDDPRYAYERFVRPLAVEVERAVEAEGVSGAAFDAFVRTDVVLELPAPLQPGARYTILAQGRDRDMVTGARTSASFAFGAEAAPRDPRLDQAVIGLRRVAPVGEGILLFEFGPGFSPEAGMDPAAYAIRINGDSATVSGLGRRTMVDAYLPRGWPFAAIPLHEVFVQLDRPLRDGDRIDAAVRAEATAGHRTASVLFDEDTVWSPSLKVNQVGYLANSPVKIAYLGRWMGSFPESRPGAINASSGEQRFWSELSRGEPAPADTERGPALLFETAPEFFLCEEPGGTTVFRGRAKLVHRSGEMNEGVFGADHSGENVYVLDFTPFRQPGTYYLRVPGVGRSVAFDIGDDVYKEAFRVQAYGVFAQRCGIELAPPHSDWRRIACHRDGIIPTSLERLRGEKTAHRELPDHVNYRAAREAGLPEAVRALNADPALLAHWHLDGSLEDASGRGHALQPLRADQSFEESIRILPGTNFALGPSRTGVSNGGVATNLSLSADRGLTLCAWVRLPGGIKFDGTLLGSSESNVHAPRLQIAAGWGVLRAHVGAGSETLDIGRLSDGEWHHIALAVEPGGGRARMLVDGVPKASGAATANFGSHPFFVGAFSGEEAGGKFIDDVRVYGRLLADREIKTLATRWGERALTISAFGGHHDAGDYNPRSHIEVARILMNAYEMAPDKFRDGQLNIPEAGNGIPDILDEAAWALRLWMGLQTEDGGVRGGTESNGDPNFIQTVELDPLGDYAFAPEAGASFTLAGAMAQASRIWACLGESTRARAFLERAERAYRWAAAHPPQGVDSAEQYASFFLSPKAYAAAELLHTTGDPAYRKDFAQVAVWSRDPEADLEKHRLYDQRAAAWAYLQCDPRTTDEDLRDAIRRAILRRADLFIEHCSTMGYGFIRHPWAPITWGTGAYQNWLDPLWWAYHLTGKEEYLAWIIRTCDNTLGANPLGISYITGLGERTVRAPLHNSRYSHFGEVVPGMQVQGPNQRGEGYRVQETAFPPLREDFANLYTFVDCHFAIAMNEGTIVNQARSLATFALLLPESE
jgi:hypothetical protein